MYDNERQTWQHDIVIRYFSSTLFLYLYTRSRHSSCNRFWTTANRKYIFSKPGLWYDNIIIHRYVVVFFSCYTSTEIVTEEKEKKKKKRFLCCAVCCAMRFFWCFYNIVNGQEREKKYRNHVKIIFVLSLSLTNAKGRNSSRSSNLVVIFSSHYASALYNDNPPSVDNFTSLLQ